MKTMYFIFSLLNDSTYPFEVLFSIQPVSMANGSIIHAQCPPSFSDNFRLTCRVTLFRFEWDICSPLINVSFAYLARSSVNPNWSILVQFVISRLHGNGNFLRITFCFLSSASSSLISLCDFFKVSSWVSRYSMSLEIWTFKVNSLFAFSVSVSRFRLRTLISFSRASRLFFRRIFSLF